MPAGRWVGNFAQQRHALRCFSMALAFPMLAAVLHQQQSPWQFWLLALSCSFLWPQLARYVVLRSAAPKRTEQRNLLTDSVLAGLWAPLLSWNLLPVLVMLTLVNVVNMVAGGWRLLRQGLLACGAGAFTGWVWAVMVWPGYEPRIEPTLLTLLATAPLLLLFPMALALLNFRRSLRLLRQRKELMQQSRIDGLSGLRNRKYWEDCVSREYERHKRSGSPLALIMMDIDQFKQINDRHGHRAGDLVIGQVSRLLANSVRTADLLGRYGGEEFGLLLPDTDLQGALHFARRLRLAVAALLIQPGAIRCSISLGVAQVDADIEHYGQLIERADKALYDAKREGRNTCRHY
ncbi:MAG: diguanylate cyclase [Halieaceae bacterium]|nr:diguanylate cyclase [Halieaceae bacterium]